MDLTMGSQQFTNVTVPLLWGTRAILQDNSGRLSIVDLGGPKARLEILGGKPAPGVDFRLAVDGTIILSPDGEDLYLFDQSHSRLTPIGLALPECRISDSQIVVGGSVFTNNRIGGFGVGIGVTSEGMFIGGPLPAGLAKLVV